MRLITVIALVMLLSAAALPGAAAESERVYYFGTEGGSGAPAGTFLLKRDAPDAGSVSVPLNGVVWADATATQAPASIANAKFNFTLAFAAPGGTVTVSYGYIPAGGAGADFFALATSAPTDVTAEARQIAVLADSGVARGQANAGPNAEIPSGVHLAIKIVPSQSKTMYTDTSTLGSQTRSAATVPLPELPAIILMALGLVTVGTVAFVRTRRA